MLDKQLFTLVIGILNTKFVALDIDVIVKQRYQPTQQGTPTQSTVFVHKISDHRYGYPQYKDVWDETAQTETQTKVQLYESMFQLSGLSIQNPKLDVQFTASDIINMAAAIMQSPETIATLKQNNVSIYRITDIRNPYFEDDRARFEADPSFDFTLQHEQVIISTSPVIEDFILNIERV